MEEKQTLAGLWANDYGSQMELSVECGLVRGVYRSTEGDVGRYRVAGIVDDRPSDNGLTFGLIVAWRDLDSGADTGNIVSGGEDLQSAHWMTSLTGQLHCIDGQDVLTTTFLLTKNTPPEDRWEDTVVNTMVFRRIPSETPNAEPSR